MKWSIFIELQFDNSLVKATNFVGDFYVSGSSETLVKISTHKYIVQTKIKVAFVIHFCSSY